MPSVSRGALWTVYLVILMDTLNFGIVFPLLPSIADTFGANAAQVGSLATAFSIAQVLCTPILGRASDRLGRRPVLLLSVLGTSLSSAVTGLAWNFPVLVAARIVNGASGATGGIANAYIADVTTGEEKPVYLSYLSAANSIGIIIGPAVGGALSRYSFEVACYVSAGLSALNLIVGVVFLTESRPSGQQGAGASLRTSGADGSPEAAPVQPARIPAKALLLFASAFLFTLGFAAFEAVTGYYLKDTFFKGNVKKSGQFYGMIFVVAGVVMFLVAAFVYRPLLRCFGERTVVVIGMVFRTAGFTFMSLAPDALYFTLAVVTQVSGSNLIMPTTSSLLTQICDRSIYGRALGYSQASGAIARVVAPIAFGEVYDKVNHRFAFYVNAVAGVLATVLILLVPKPPVEESDAGPTEEDVEANVSTFERQVSAPKIDDVTPMATALVRSTSERLARSLSVERARRQASTGNTSE